MKSLSDCYVLSNGVKIPCIGYGTFKQPEGDDTVACVKEALKVGYRHIDSAGSYKNEKSVGIAIRESGVPREEIFVTSKLWNADQGYDSTLRAFEHTMNEFGFDYLDMYLIHWPIPLGHKEDFKELNLETWRAFEKVYKEGRVRAIGVCNYLQHHLEPLMENAEIQPMVNQFEIHPQYPQEETIAFCQKNNIQVEAWGPLMRGRIIDIPLIAELAKKYGKTEAQIAVRWSLQHNLLPLPKSANFERIRKNAEVFDFEISGEDMERIDELKSARISVGFHPDNFTLP